jgi:hypothetical protein
MRQENSNLNYHSYSSSLLPEPQPVPPQALRITTADGLNLTSIVTTPERIGTSRAHGHFSSGTEVYPPWLLETPPASLQVRLAGARHSRSLLKHRFVGRRQA